MKIQFGYCLLILLSAFSCKEKPAGHSSHNMAGTEGTGHEEMNLDTAIESFLYDVINSVNEVVISNQATVKLMVRELKDTLSAGGYIAFDERRSNKVSARFGGRVEKLYVRYNYQYVKKGEKIMGLYSPAINTIQEEYVHHLATLSDKALLQKTKDRLLLLGLAENEISEIEKRRKPVETISVYSPYEGFVIFDVNEKNRGLTISEMQNGMNMGMVSVQNGVGDQVPASSLREGSYVNRGQTLFVVNDFKEVWGIAAFPPEEVPMIQPGAPVTITSELTDEPVKASVNFIEPIFKEKQKFMQARIYIKNESLDYKIHSLISVHVETAKKLRGIPISAVLDLGKRKIVWVKTGNEKFQVRTIVSGNELKGYTEIVSGITERDEIAEDAGFMIDSESLIHVRPQ